jgi:alpha-L-arabinofuranosidase
LRADRPISVRISFQSADGKVYASQIVRVVAGHWAKVPFALTPSQTDSHARFAIETSSAGVLDIGYAFAEPGAWGRFKGLPVRADVVRAMQAQGLQAIRFGGCANSGCGDVSDYKWKAMIGDPALRPVTRGFWYPYESNGFGIFEFLQLGEALGIEAVPSLNIDESPDDIRDLMEYLYGDPQTPWGAKRVADGHPAPYKVRRFELGNEDAINDDYYAKFKAMADIIWSYDRDIRLVVGDFTYDEVIKDPYDFRGGGKATSLAAHRKILELATAHGAEVDFDVHIWTRSINDSGWKHEKGNLGSQIAALDSYAAALHAIAPKDARFKVVVFELNADTHDLTRALANAYAITALQQRPYIAVVSSANAFQVDGQNDNGWDQGLIFMNQADVWTQPPYDVHRIIVWSTRGEVLRTDVRGGDPMVVATAFRDAAGRSLSVVNPTDHAISYNVSFGAVAGSARLEVKRLGPDRAKAVNTAGNLQNIGVEEDSARLDAEGRTTITLPARSFTAFRTVDRR